MKREEISARYLYFRRGKEKSARSNERSPFESFQIVEWELGTRYAHRTGALDAFSRFEVGSNRRDQRKIRERWKKKEKLTAISGKILFKLEDLSDRTI